MLLTLLLAWVIKERSCPYVLCSKAACLTHMHVPVMLWSWSGHVFVVHDCCSCGAATQGLKTFEHYQDPKTGKEGKVNVGVTVGQYRGNKLVRAAGHYCFSVCIAAHVTCSAQEQQTGHTYCTFALHLCLLVWSAKISLICPVVLASYIGRCS